MDLDVATLLEPVDESSPCGPDRSYAVERAEIERVFQTSFSVAASGEKQQDVVDWDDKIKQIAEELKRSKDLWLAIYVARAGAMAGRLDVAATGVVLLGEMLNLYWDQLHPKLEEVDLPGRAQACESLNQGAAFLEKLARAPIIRNPRLGNFGVVDLERFAANKAAEPDFQLFTEAMKAPDANGAVKAALEAFDKISAGLSRVEDVFREKTAGEGALKLEAARTRVTHFIRTLSPFAPGAAATGETGSAISEGEPGNTFVGGRLETREGVIRALNAIEDYYRRKEPSSPVPLLMERARAWVVLPFMEILDDIAPASIEDARKVLVRRKQENI